MKKSLFTLAMLAFSVSSFAQNDIFALTGKSTQTITFQDFRSVDTRNGISGATYLTSNDTPNVFSSVLNKPVSEDKKSYNNAQSVSMAALAVDSRNHLIYMPLYSTNIYALDMKTKEITLLENHSAKNTACNLGSQFTRMATGADGNVYAVSNSGSQFLKISNENGKYSVVDLGEIKDDAKNGKNSLKVMNIGFGGDMIADSDNNFYLFSASGNVFKVSASTLNAEFIGKINGLPENYSLNGAAVDSEGNIVVASAKGGNFYTIDLEKFQAEPLSSKLNMPVYDLASSYLLKGKKSVPVFAQNEIYPTNVTENFINIRLNNESKGNVKVQVYNTAGSLVQSQTYNNAGNSEQRIDLNNPVSGVYVVKVSKENGKQILTKKILVK